MIKYEVKDYNFDNLLKIEVNPKSLKDYNYAIEALKYNEIKKAVSKRDFIAKQGVKHLRQKLELEREFIPDIKEYFIRQSRLIKNKQPNILTIQPCLEAHYKRVAEKIIGRNIKQLSVDDTIKMLIYEKVKKQAGIIDGTTNEEIETSVNMARQQLADEGEFSPSQTVLYMIAAKIFLNRMQGRIQGIVTTETQGMYEALRYELLQNANNELTEVIVEGNRTRAREIADLTESYTHTQIADSLEKPRQDNRALFALIALAMKMWLTMGDLKVRRWHQEANGQTVAVTMLFMVMGEMLRFPGDQNGSAKNIVNCFMNAKTPIFTNNGWKKIKDIKIGDKVLTHKNRFRNVTRTSVRNYSGDIILIKIKGIRNKSAGLCVTPNHRFLTSLNEWKEAKDLTVNDKLKCLASFCEFCGKPIIWERKYCSRSCNSKATTKKQWADPAHRENISKKASLQIKKEYSIGIRDKNEITKKARKVQVDKYGDGGYIGKVRNNKEFQKKIRDGVENKYGSYLNLLKKYAFPALGKANFAGTKIENAMENFLIRKNKKYKKQYQVGRRRIDFYINMEKTFIEVDGERFHKDKERERQRDLEILLKYPDHKIAHVSYGKGDKGQPKWEYFTLEDLNHTGTFTQIDVEIESIENKRTNNNRQKFNKAYNFAVEEDESYMARGIVSHNCRCSTIYI